MTEINKSVGVNAGGIDPIEQAKGNLEALFESFKQGTTIGGANQLAMTAQLTNASQNITNTIMTVIAADPEKFEGYVQASMKSHDAMDDLIAMTYDLEENADYDFLEGLDEEEIDKMIRSQQSKRSRSKSKAMTKENYLTMMTGAVAENLLRLASGKAKSAGGGASMGDVGYSDEQLAELAADTELLKKAIRNVQSKKSIMKAKADYDEESPRWQALLEAERQLKGLRDHTSAAVSEEAKKALESQKAAEELLGKVSTDDLSEDEAKAMLDSLKEMLASK